jgi:hypothetical protein
LGLTGRKYKKAEENCIVRTFVILIPHQVLLGRSDKKNVMSWSRGTYRREQKRIQGFGEINS